MSTTNVVVLGNSLKDHGGIDERNKKFGRGRSNYFPLRILKDFREFPCKTNLGMKFDQGFEPRNAAKRFKT